MSSRQNSKLTRSESRIRWDEFFSAAINSDDRIDSRFCLECEMIRCTAATVFDQEFLWTIWNILCVIEVIRDRRLSSLAIDFYNRRRASLMLVLKLWSRRLVVERVLSSSFWQYSQRLYLRIVSKWIRIRSRLRFFRWLHWWCCLSVSELLTKWRIILWCRACWENDILARFQLFDSFSSIVHRFVNDKSLNKATLLLIDRILIFRIRSEILSLCRIWLLWVILSQQDSILQEVREFNSLLFSWKIRKLALCASRICMLLTWRYQTSRNWTLITREWSRWWSCEREHRKLKLIVMRRMTCFCEFERLDNSNNEEDINVKVWIIREYIRRRRWRRNIWQIQNVEFLSERD